MARRRLPAPPAGVRARLLDRARQNAADYAAVMGADHATQFAARVAALEAGEPVVVAGWQLRRAERGGLPVAGWVRVEPDGTLRWFRDHYTAAGRRPT